MSCINNLVKTLVDENPLVGLDEVIRSDDAGGGLWGRCGVVRRDSYMLRLNGTPGGKVVTTQKHIAQYLVVLSSRIW